MTARPKRARVKSTPMAQVIGVLERIAKAQARQANALEDIAAATYRATRASEVAALLMGYDALGALQRVAQGIPDETQRARADEAGKKNRQVTLNALVYSLNLVIDEVTTEGELLVRTDDEPVKGSDAKPE